MGQSTNFIAGMKKNGNILIVVNPISGNTNKKAIIEMLEAQLSGIPIKKYETTGEKDGKKIRRLIKKYRPERVLAVGGDGTIKLVAENLKNHPAILGILPSGSANGLARDLDIPTSPKRYVPIALGNKTREIDAISINDQFCLHISDFGLNAELIKKYEESNSRGKFGYFINSIPTLYDTNMPYDFKVRANGKVIREQGMMLAIANSRKYGTGVVINPTGKIDDGKFEILIFKKFDLLQFLNSLKGESEIPSRFVETIITDKATILTKTPVDFQIDGEYRKAIKKVKAKILPRRLKIAVGE